MVLFKSLLEVQWYLLFFLLMRQSCLLNLTAMVPSLSYESRVAKMQSLSFPPFPLGMAELGQGLIVWFQLAAQSSPRCSPHMCMPKTKQSDRLHFGDTKCAMGVCPAVWQGKDHGVLVKHDSSTSTKPASFSYMSLSWEGMREYRWQKCHD